ncbi:MAG: Thioredoxin-like 4A, partial [Paramarteilia canceri]
MSLINGWSADQAILSENDRVVAIRFGKDSHPRTIEMDHILQKASEKVKNFCIIYTVDTD